MLSRRSFLAMTALSPLSRLAARPEAGEHHFQYDHVIGTSMDLLVWTPDAGTAQRARDAAVGEIERLTSILSTRDPHSEISRYDSGGPLHSLELRELLAAYESWRDTTSGAINIRPRGPGGERNVDALGKAYIIARAVEAAKRAVPTLDGLLLNIGGDIVVCGRPCDIAVTDPAAWQDNAEPLVWLRLKDAAIASSGAYARGAHLYDGRTGNPVAAAASATVVARDAVTANALATALCVMTPEEGMPLVERTAGAEAIRISPAGVVHRSSGFAALEQPRRIRTAARAANWPEGYQLDIALTLTTGAGSGRGGFGRGGRGGFAQRLYVAIWVEDSAGKLVRVLAFWADKPRYYTELSSFFGTVRNQNRLATLARATRSPGSYHIVWDGLDDQQMPVTPGTYKIVVETNQEHGQYAKQAASIECGDKPATAMTPATSNFEAITMQYGPRPKTA